MSNETLSKLYGKSVTLSILYKPTGETTRVIFPKFGPNSLAHHGYTNRDIWQVRVAVVN